MSDRWGRVDELLLDAAPPVRDYAGVVIPFELRTPAGVLSFFGTTTVFGTPIDITLAELALESFFPANARTAEVLRMLAGEHVFVRSP